MGTSPRAGSSQELHGRASRHGVRSRCDARPRPRRPALEAGPHAPAGPRDAAGAPDGLARAGREVGGQEGALTLDAAAPSVRPRPSDARCPFCHDAIGGDGVACAACSAPHHVECWAELDRCAVCQTTARAPAPVQEQEAFEAGPLEVLRVLEPGERLLWSGRRSVRPLLTPGTHDASADFRHTLVLVERRP